MEARRAETLAAPLTTARPRPFARERPKDKLLETIEKQYKGYVISNLKIPLMEAMFTVNDNKIGPPTGTISKDQNALDILYKCQYG